MQKRYFAASALNSRVIYDMVLISSLLYSFRLMNAVLDGSVQQPAQKYRVASANPGQHDN